MNNKYNRVTEEKLTVKEQLSQIEEGADAVFLPGKLHGCEDQIYIIYLNPQACGGNMGYKKLIQEAYKKYVKDWCEARGYKPEDVDLETGINGECYVCINEFEQNEFQDEEYMAMILTDTEFGMWQDHQELKNILLQSMISRIYFRQKAGHFSKCPRCGNKMDPKLSHNAFSRRSDVYVCSTCGTYEAIEDAPCPPFDKVPKKPIEEWDFAQDIVFNT